MLENLITILKQADTDGWKVIETTTDGWEFYFIRHALDQNRIRNVRHIQLTVYKLIEDGKYLGSASADIAPTARPEELKQIVAGLLYQASLVQNRPYALTPKHEIEAGKDSAPLENKEAEKFIRTFDHVHETDTEDLNSYEIFTSVITRRLVTSTGIDVTETYPSSMCEVVVNARKDSHEIELYRMYHSGTCDEAGLKAEIENTMRYGRDRLSAKPTPNLGAYPVLFSTDAALQIYNYFLNNLNTAYVFRKMSVFEIGKPVFSDVKGDTVTIETKKMLENSDHNFLVDEEGSPIREVTLMKDNVPLAYWGGRMFSQYLGIDESFQITNCVIKGGSAEEEELRKGDALEIVEFSDFQVDAMTGDIFGEIRLGYLKRNGETLIVTGGSVSGDIKECLKDVHMSKEMKQYNNMCIPSLTLLKNVTVTGAGE